MALSVISNQSAHIARRHLELSSANAVESLARLSSGQRTMSARDDASSLAIGLRLNAEARSISVATTNVSQASAMLQIVDGAMDTVTMMLVRMKYLAVQGASSGLSTVERSFVFDEFRSVRAEIDRIAADTDYNGNKLLAGTYKSELNPADRAAGGSAAGLSAAKGFSAVSFALDAPNVRDGDRFTLAYNATTATFTATNTTSGHSQEIDFAFKDRDDALGALYARLRSRYTIAPSIAGAPLLPLLNVIPRLPAIPLLGIMERPNPSFNPLQKRITDIGEAAEAAELGRRGAVASDFSTDAAAQDDIISVARAAATRAAAPHFAAPVAGTTRELTFSEFGLTVTLNSAFNGRADLNASNGFGVSRSARDTGMTYQIGTGATAGEDSVSVTLGQINLNTLNPDLNRIRGFTTAKDAGTAIGHVTRAIDLLQSSRAKIGSVQNRLQFARQNLLSSMEHNDAAHATLTDLDVVSEMIRFTARHIAMQSGISMLSQANLSSLNLARLML